ncbi:MAG TPA: NAD-dependent epimerase/dehydratase family protein, partial [Victivallales bacterium]|nr:NAD-dependent epimerase/dehydratase family protein [Victivallales bacterium]
MSNIKKILVTGGAGYIGSACTEYLLDMDYDVTVLDSLVTGHKDAIDQRADFIHADLSNRELTIQVLK